MVQTAHICVGDVYLAVVRAPFRSYFGTSEVAYPPLSNGKRIAWPTSFS
jgi:hypothetical protein